MPGIHSRDSLKETSKDVLRWLSEQTARTLMSIKQKLLPRQSSSIERQLESSLCNFCSTQLQNSNSSAAYNFTNDQHAHALSQCPWDKQNIFTKQFNDIGMHISTQSLIKRPLIFTLYMTQRAFWGIIAFNGRYFHILHPLLCTQTALSD